MYKYGTGLATARERHELSALANLTIEVWRKVFPRGNIVWKEATKTTSTTKTILGLQPQRNQKGGAPAAYCSPLQTSFWRDDQSLDSQHAERRTGVLRPAADAKSSKGPMQGLVTLPCSLLILRLLNLSGCGSWIPKYTIKGSMLSNDHNKCTKVGTYTWEVVNLI